ncbi:hypothetical protein AB0L10_25925 [Streptomyces flaveolus]
MARGARAGPRLLPKQCSKARERSEAIVGAMTGTLAAPRTLLLGWYDD